MSAEEAPPTLEWSGQAVDVLAIDAALQRLRQEAADGAPAEGAAQPAEGTAHGTRTSVLTLVTYAFDGATAQRATQTIANLPEYHPSRSIVVLAEPSDDEPVIDARLSAHCHIAPGLEGQVCFEEIALTVKGRAAGHLHSIVLPLLVPDLPVFGWWTGDLPDDSHLLDDVLDTADRLIVDSTRFGETERSLARLAHLMQSRGAVLSDLGWARLNPWRQLIAQFFDEPGLRQYLDRLTALDIEHASGSSAQALLLAGWLADRLGWRPSGKQNHTYRARSAGGDVIVSVHAEPAPDREPGSLLSVLLKASKDGRTATFRVQRREPQLATAAAKAPETSFERTVRLATGGDPEMLAEELETAGRDQAYSQALATAASLSGS